MVQKLLKFFLIGKVQEYYFINLAVVSLIFFTFHLEVIKDQIVHDEDPVKAAFAMVAVTLALVSISWALVKNKDHAFLTGGTELVSIVPYLTLTIVSLLATVATFHDKVGLIEIVISRTFLLAYGIKLSVMFLYLLLHRYGFKSNLVFKSINQRLNDAVGNYQTSTQEVLIIIAATLPTVFLLSQTSLNPYAQYLSAYLVADMVARAIEKIRTSTVVRN